MSVEEWVSIIERRAGGGADLETALEMVVGSRAAVVAAVQTVIGARDSMARALPIEAERDTLLELTEGQVVRKTWEGLEIFTKAGRREGEALLTDQGWPAALLRYETGDWGGNLLWQIEAEYAVLQGKGGKLRTAQVRRTLGGVEVLIEGGGEVELGRDLQERIFWGGSGEARVVLPPDGYRGKRLECLIGVPQFFQPGVRAFKLSGGPVELRADGRKYRVDPVFCGQGGDELRRFDFEAIDLAAVWLRRSEKGRLWLGKRGAAMIAMESGVLSLLHYPGEFSLSDESVFAEVMERLPVLLVSRLRKRGVRYGYLFDDGKEVKEGEATMANGNVHDKKTGELVVATGFEQVFCNSPDVSFL